MQRKRLGSKERTISFADIDFLQREFGKEISDILVCCCERHAPETQHAAAAAADPAALICQQKLIHFLLLPKVD